MIVTIYWFYLKEKYYLTYLIAELELSILYKAQRDVLFVLILLSNVKHLSKVLLTTVFYQKS